MNIKGVIITDENYANTVAATEFALRYFKDLNFNTAESSIDDGYQDGDIVVVSLPYVDNNIASGYEPTVKTLYTEKNVVWIVLLIKDDVLEKGNILLDDFINKLNDGKDVYTEHFTEMTSERNIPLQTRAMMQIMSLCDKVIMKYK